MDRGGGSGPDPDGTGIEAEVSGPDTTGIEAEVTGPDTIGIEAEIMDRPDGTGIEAELMGRNRWDWDRGGGNGLRPVRMGWRQSL